MLERRVKRRLWGVANARFLNWHLCQRMPRSLVNLRRRSASSSRERNHWPDEACNHAPRLELHGDGDMSMTRREHAARHGWSKLIGSISGACTGSCLLAFGVPASAAEDQQNDSYSLEEVVVTAQKRRETLQDIPLAISAVNAEALERSGSRSFNDYIRSVPGVSFVDRGPTENKLVIRGVSDGPFAPTAPTTGVYIDETPVTEPNRNADLNMFDVERVEVLRGPQGTLYGAGSMGGTVRVILNKPAVDAFAASADTTFASTRHGDESYAVNGMVNVPIVTDKFAVRAVAYSREDGGFIDDVARGIEDVNKATVEGGRVLARLVATDNLTVQAGVTYQKIDADGRPQEDLALGDLQQRRIFAEHLDSTFELYNLQIDYDFGVASLVSSTSYYDKDAFNSVDYSDFLSAAVGLPVVLPFGIENDNGFENLVQEVRLVSSDEQRLRWIIGGFYSDQDSSARQFVGSGELGLPLPIFDATTNSSTRETALFGELSFDFTDRLRGTVGARWFDVSQDYGVTQAPSLQGGSSIPETDASDSDVNLKFHLAYEISPDNRVYAQAAQGYRIGGINPPAGPQCPAAAGSYGPDTLWNYELGSKNTLLDRRLQLNAAVYYIEWSDMQVAQTFLCGSRAVQNAGKSTSQGVEVELRIAPVKSLEIASSLSYSDTELEQVAAGVPYIEGSQLPGVPEWSGSVAAQYSFPVASLGGYVRLDWQYVGNSISDFDDTSTLASIESYAQASYSIAGLRVGVQADRWEVALFLNNAFDEKAYTFVRDLAVPGVLTSTVNRPQTAGVNLKARF